MKIKKALIASMLAVALFGCGKRETRHIVVLPDVSGSIERESLEQAFKAIDDLAGHLQRGDRLTIIPILGDAEAEASGRILRFEVPANRQVYDTDLRSFRSKLSASLKAMHDKAIVCPGSKTDILGSIQLSAQEFKAVSESKQTLMILSDFIHEDDDINFRSDGRLANQIDAGTFATRTAKTQRLHFTGVQVYLGLLRSNEYLRLNRNRREALRSFWTTYFGASETQPYFVTDGLGLLTEQSLKP
jgi:hypothetical protein